ncbi:MAG: dinucleotide-utilizing protein, partial [Bacteroidetes bacterium]
MTMNEQEEKYYKRQILLPEIGINGQALLHNSSVLIVGAGGLGCPILDFLARAGIGKIGVVDGDIVEISNLHRQSLYTMTDIGELKVNIAQKVLLNINPFIKVETYSEMLTNQNALTIISQYDIVVDATDNYPTRYLVNDACVVLQKPLVYGAIYRFEGQIGVFNYKGGATYRCLFPNYPKAASETNCSTAGVIGVLPGIIGLMQANEVIKIILNSNEVLSNRLLSYSAKTGRTSTINIRRNNSFDYSTLMKNGQLEHNFYAQSCDSLEDIYIDELFSKTDFNICLIDVRDPNEEPIFKHKSVILMPLYEIDSVQELPIADLYVTICMSGVRSKSAQKILNRQFPNKKILNLKGG